MGSDEPSATSSGSVQRQAEMTFDWPRAALLEMGRSGAVGAAEVSEAVSRGGMTAGTGAGALTIVFVDMALLKQRSRLAQRRFAEGCVSVSGAPSKLSQTSSRPLLSSQPSFTP